MSTAIPTTLNHEQRSEAFTKALALEDGLKDLASYTERLLAWVERQAEAMRNAHAQLMRAAATGESPEASEQQPLSLDPAPAAPSQAPATATAPLAEDDQPPPEGPEGKGRSRSRKPSSEKTGKKRARATSARAASAPQASATPALAMEDAIPAPRVPCCECTHSVADHKNGTGRCNGKVQGRPCKCRRFTGVAVDLPGSPGWKVRPFIGRLSTGEGGELAYTLVTATRETLLPLWWVPRYGLAFQAGGALSCIFSYLGMRATTLSYEKDPKWNWVPREVLRALAEYMGATWPTKRDEPAAPEGPQAEQAPASKNDTPCTCDSCGETFKASELQPVGNGFYCAGCKAEADEQDGEAVDAPPAGGTRAAPELDDPFEVPATDGKADSSFDALDLSTLHSVLGQPPPGYSRRYKVTISGGSPRACEACGTRERPRAFVSFDREDRKGQRGAYTGGGGFAMALCLDDCTVEGVRRGRDNRRHSVEAERLDRAAKDGTGETDTNAPPKDLFGKPWPAVDEARFPGWFVWVIRGVHGKPDSIAAGRLHELFFDMDVKGPEGQDVRHLRWFPAAEGGPRVLVGPHTEPNVALDTLFPAGLYAALVEHLATHWPLPEETKAAAQAPAAPAPKKAKTARPKKAARPEGTSEPETSPATAPVPAAESGAWRVELSERNEGHSIVRLWLVDVTTQERKPATWWSGVSSLRPGHRLSGSLEREALAAHLELTSWWKANAEAVVAPLAEACREGRVPGLKVYEPEALGTGPHKYALSGGWTLEAWEGEGEEAEPTVHFTRPTSRSDIWERFGPFVLGTQGLLTGATAEAADWSADNEAVVRDAESFIARGFIFELRRAEAA